MIDFDAVSVTYAGASEPALLDVDLHIREGEMALVVGRTGAGKSTLLRAACGLVPHFSGGTLRGRVTVAGRDTRSHPPRELADVIGFVGQDPLAGFVTDNVEDELAYGMESLGIAPAVMRRRVEETLDLLGIADLRERPLLTLSAGQRQRVAIGSVLAVGPRVLVLDEPTSALDPGGAEEVLAALTRLVDDLGVTVLLAEHRLERVVQYADVLVWVRDDGSVVSGPPADLIARTPVTPPVVELGRAAGWSPLPLSVRDARRSAAGLRRALAGLTPPSPRPPYDGEPEEIATARRLVAVYPGAVAPALRGVDFAVRRGEVVALMGRNGAGKSTLLAHLVGLREPASGQVRLMDRAPHALAPAELVRHAGFVPQQPADLLYRDTVARECADSGPGSAPTVAMALLLRLAPDVDPAAHPRDLSEGQRLALALAVVAASDPPLLLLDEPTRGLDYPGKRALVGVLRERAARGGATVVATHDVELAAEVADRTVVLADGEIVTDGPTASVVTDSPAFAPQVAKIMAPQRWLSVADVVAALPPGAAAAAMPAGTAP